MKTQVAFTAIYVRKISEEARNLCAIMPMNRVTRFVHTLEWKKGGGGGHVERGYFSHSFKYREKVAPGRRKCCRAEGRFFPSLIRIS